MIRSISRPRRLLPICLAVLACPAGTAWSAELCPNLNVTVTGTSNTITGCNVNAGETLQLPTGTAVTGNFVTVVGSVSNAGNYLVPGPASTMDVVVSSVSTTDHIFRNLVGGVFENDGYIRLQSAFFSVRFGGATFDNAGTLNNHYKVEVGTDLPFSFPTYSVFNNTGTVHSDGTFTVIGTLNNHPGGTGFFNDANGVIANTATGIIANDGSFANAAGATITNAGALNNDAGGVLTNGGLLRSTGRFANHAGATLNNTGSMVVTNLVDDGEIVNDWMLLIDDGTSGQQTSTLVVNGRLQNRAPGQILNQGTITVGASGVIENAGSLLMNPSNSALNNAGTITNLAGGTLGLRTVTQLNNLAGGRLINQGTIENAWLLNNAGAIDIQPGSTLNNRNTVRNLAGGQVTIGGLVNNHSLQNAGEISIATTGVVQGDGSANERYVQTAGTTRVDGWLASALVDVQGGMVTGTGTIGRPGSTINFAAPATLDPGSSGPIGTLSLLGNTRLAGRLEIDLANDTTFDILQNLGSFDIAPGSQIELRFASGFHAALGSELTFLDATNLSGLAFLTITAVGATDGYNWMYVTGAARGTLGISFTAVPLATPLPGSLSMFISALFGGAVLRKPRRRP